MPSSPPPSHALLKRITQANGLLPAPFAPTFVGGNQITLLNSGGEFFPALIAAIQAAQFEIYLQTYIYLQDSSGRLVSAALMQAAKRGVKVYVLADGFGSRHLPASLKEAFAAAGVVLMFYRPQISPWTLKKNRLRRLHRKVTVIDGHTALVGGINIVHDVDASTTARLDYAVAIQGQLVTSIASNVRQLWRRIAWLQLNRSRHHTPPLLQAASMQTADIKAAFVIRDNVLHRHDIENAYLSAIAQAQHEIIIANAFFIPGRRFRQALIAAAKRGVKVELLLQGRLEHLLMFSTLAFYQAFLKHGIHIYEYRKSLMHSKVAVIDQHWATVGSSNIDPFSLLLAHEANIFIQDSAFAMQLRADIQASIQQGAQQITLAHWQNLPMILRALSWLTYGFVRFLLGLIGYGKE